MVFSAVKFIFVPNIKCNVRNYFVVTSTNTVLFTVVAVPNILITSFIFVIPLTPLRYTNFSDHIWRPFNPEIKILYIDIGLNWNPSVARLYFKLIEPLVYSSPSHGSCSPI